MLRSRHSHACPAAAVGAGIPAEFVMKNTTKFADPMLAFADKGGELGEEARGGWGDVMRPSLPAANSLLLAVPAAVAALAGKLHFKRFQCVHILVLPAAAEGKVWQKFDCEVARKTPAGGAAAGGKVRTGRNIDDGLQRRMAEGASY